MKNVLLLIHDDDGQEARLQAALDITRAVEGHLACVDVSMLPVFVGGDTGAYYTGVGEGVLLRDECTRETANKTRIKARLTHEDVSWDWADAIGTIADAVLDRVTLADMVVLNRRLDATGYPDMVEAASQILMRARTPVMAVPQTLGRLGTDHALVAWDGSASCAATLRASVPLLARAVRVDIVTVRDGADRAPPEAAAAYLSRHGIHPEVRLLDDRRITADQHILDEARQIGADYIVMGAYGRGRLRETFGSVTRRMLAHAHVPLVLGH